MSSNGFHRLVPDHQDLVLALDYNIYGNRMVTASSDHRLKVWDRDETSNIWNVTDTWLAHDAEVTDVKWNAPFVGEHIGSIGEDGIVRIWQEDIKEAANSGRRFKKIFERPSDTGLPFMSIEFKNAGSDTYLALITRDGFLSVLEPEESDDLSSWRTLWAEQVCKPRPARTEETGFRLSWHKEPIPAWPIVLAGLDRKSLSLAIGVGDVVRIFRTDKSRNFYIAATLEGARGLIRDVSWANGSMRGFDIIAAASKDGYVRIYELHTPGAASLSTSAQDLANHSNGNQHNSHPRRPVRSGIGAGLANGAGRYLAENGTLPGAVKQEPKLVAEIDTHESAPWRVNWSEMGDILVSTGDDGSVRMWKKAVDGKWLEAADVDAL